MAERGKKNDKRRLHVKYFEALFPGEEPKFFCVTFLYWCFCKSYGTKTGRSILYSGPDYYLEPYKLERCFKLNGRLKYECLIGDIVFVKNSHDWTDHAGLVVEKDDEGFYSIDGGITNRKGELCVAKIYRPFRNSIVMGYGHPNYGILKEARK